MWLVSFVWLLLGAAVPRLRRLAIRCPTELNGVRRGQRAPKDVVGP